MLHIGTNTVYIHDVRIWNILLLGI